MRLEGAIGCYGDASGRAKVSVRQGLENKDVVL